MNATNILTQYESLIGRVTTKPKTYHGEFGTCARLTMEQENDTSFVINREVTMIMDEDGESGETIDRFVADATHAYEHRGSTRLHATGLRKNTVSGDQATVVNEAYLVPIPSLSDLKVTMRGSLILARLFTHPDYISVGLLEVPEFNERGLVELILDGLPRQHALRIEDILRTTFQAGRRLEVDGSLRNDGQERLYVSNLRSMPKLAQMSAIKTTTQTPALPAPR